MHSQPTPPENPFRHDPLVIVMIVVWFAMLGGAIAYLFD